MSVLLNISLCFGYIFSSEFIHSHVNRCFALCKQCGVTGVESEFDMGMQKNLRPYMAKWLIDVLGYVFYGLHSCM